MLLSQVYPNLVAIAISATFSKGSLTLFDVHYALAITASPSTLYIVCVAYLRLFHLLWSQDREWKRKVFRDSLNMATEPGRMVEPGHNSEPEDPPPQINQQEISSRSHNHRRKIKLSTSTLISLGLSLVLPWLWIALQVVASFSTTAFSNSQLCDGMPLSRWFEFQLLSSFLGFLDLMSMRNFWGSTPIQGGLGFLGLLMLVISQLCLVLQRHQIYKRFHAKMKEQGSRDSGLPTRILNYLSTLRVVCWYVLPFQNAGLC